MAPIAVLVGLPGSGKTSAGRRVAGGLGIAFADSDALIEQRTGRSVREIFAVDGEATFREWEERVVERALASFDGLLSLGGGAVLCGRTRQRLRDSGVPVVLLVTDPAQALARVHGGRGRPLLAGDPAARLRELARQRGPLYDEVATVRVPSGGRTLVQLTDDLAALLGVAASNGAHP